MDKPWGQVYTKSEILSAIELHQPDTVWICYAETSTGTRQPLEGIGAACRALKKECLLIVDSVTAIGGVELRVDELLIDASYAGEAQKKRMIKLNSFFLYSVDPIYELKCC